MGIGGRQGKLAVAAFEVYDFATSRWRSLPDIPSKRVFALYAHSDTHIFSVGGLHQDPRQGFSDVAEVFDLDTGMCVCASGILQWRGLSGADRGIFTKGAEGMGKRKSPVASKVKDMVGALGDRVF